MANQLSAYELADWLTEHSFLKDTEIAMMPVINMLRQQADRIAELEKQCEALADEYAIQVNEVCKLSYEIENLKAGLLSHNDIYPAKDESFDRTASHMANEYVSHYEPTAWINHIKQTGGDFYELNVSGRGEPLYRHPPQTKPLSDEEIKELHKSWTRWIDGGYELQVVHFARAIEAKVRGQ